MTKAELIEAMKDFPDDMELGTMDDFGCWLVESVKLEDGKYWGMDKPFILIR